MDAVYNPANLVIGLITSYTFGGLIHILLVAAVILLIIRLTRDALPDKRRQKVW